jgi:hypothetical protein
MTPGAQDDARMNRNTTLESTSYEFEPVREPTFPMGSSASVYILALPEPFHTDLKIASRYRELRLSIILAE